jgi:DNA-binding transcriptional ArsR family regulator
MSPARNSPPLRDDVAESVADAMFALSTPNRVQILACLLGGPKSVSELEGALGMEQSAVSHQLRVLREYRLVKVERQGRRAIYALYDDEVVVLLEAALRHVERRAKRSGSLVRKLGRASG